MDTLARAIPELHVYFPEIVLAELSSKPFETHQRPGRFWAKRGDQIVERSLASLISGLSHPSQDLKRRQVGSLQQNPNRLFPEILRCAGPPDLSFASFGLIIDMHDRLFLRDAPRRAQRNATHVGHLCFSVARLQ